MSKSYNNTIQLSEPPESIRAKLKTMVTDPARVCAAPIPAIPDKCPVGDLHKIFSSKETLAKVYEGCRSAGIGCIECKAGPLTRFIAKLAPIQELRRKYEANPKAAWDILEAGSRKAEVAAETTMEQARAAMHMTKDYEAPSQAAAATKNRCQKTPKSRNRL